MAFTDGKDYHPPGHISFATTHPPHQPFTELEVTDIRGKRYAQMLWPDHCVQGTRGAEIDKEIRVHLNRWNDRLKIVRKVRLGISVILILGLS